MARKAKTDGEKPNTDPVSAGPGMADDTGTAAKAGNQPEESATKNDSPAVEETGATPTSSDEMPGSVPDSDPFDQPSSAAKAEPPRVQSFQSLTPDAPIREPARRRSVIPMLLAGVVTAALGFAAAWFLLRDGGPLADKRLPLLDGRVADLDQRLTKVEAAEADNLKAAALDPLTARLDEIDQSLTSGLADAAAARDALAKAIEEVRQRPADTDPAAVAAYEAELKAMRAMLDKQLTTMRAELDAELDTIRKTAAEASQAQQQAAAAGNRAEVQAALAEIDAALDTGAGFKDSLDRLAGLSPKLPVDGLRPYEGGVDSLATLQRDFPDAARAAINADLASGSGEGGAIGFLKAQLGMRSLAPTEGNSADAILSRAEASLQSGDLDGALTEIGTLTGPAADKMAAWTARADRRRAALTAFATVETAGKN